MADVSPNAPTRRQLPVSLPGSGDAEPAVATAATATASGTTTAAQAAAAATSTTGADGRPVKAKRKRLSKACDACHKSKRRCDGTAPCSNCYFAEKECVYTNAAGRLVSAPRPPRNLAPATEPDGHHNHNHARKRVRQDDDDARGLDLDRPSHGGVGQNSHHLHTLAGHPGQNHDGHHQHQHPTQRNSPPPLEPSLVHELINLFFAHCHPQRLVLHKPSFHAKLAKNQVPLHLLYAMCALSAMYSRRPSLRTGAPTPRLIGVPFAQAAQDALFDSHSGRLQVPPDLSAVQALVLLEMAHFTAHLDGVQEGAYQGPPRRAGLALDIARRLLSDNNQGTVERECTRRAMWLTYTLGLMGHLFLNRTDAHQRRRCIDTGMRLPLDETRFELAELVGTPEPEHLNVPAPKSPYASEYGHWIRTTTISFDLKLGLTEAGEDQNKQRAVIERIEHELRVWEASLPEHLAFSQDGLAQQMSMFETGANAGAWCYCMFHTTHASTVLAADTARASLGLGPPVDRYHCAAERLKSVVDSLGTRARNSPLKGVAIFPLFPLYGPNDPTLRSWQADIADLWEIRIVDLASDMESLKVASGSSPAILGASAPAFSGVPALGKHTLPGGGGGIGLGMGGLSGPGRGAAANGGYVNPLEGPGVPHTRTSPQSSMFGPSTSMSSVGQASSSSPPTARRQHYELARTSPGSDRDRAERYREGERDSSPSSHGSVVSNGSRYSDGDGVRSRESTMTGATSWDGGGGMMGMHAQMQMHSAHSHSQAGAMLSGPGSMGASGVGAAVTLPSLRTSGLLGAHPMDYGHAPPISMGMAPPPRRAPNGMPWLAEEMR